MSIDYSLHQFRSPLFQSVVSEALTFFANTPIHNLPPHELFEGVGVYALYLTNENTIYKQIGDLSSKRPIYVGKAVPRGWRTARVSTLPQGSVLYNRLREHSRSIIQVGNLDLDDFRCRFVILNDIESDLVVPVEAELIRQYTPIWNTQLHGFGNHDPGSGRYNQSPSEWDTLHPGRSWASRLLGKPPSLDVIRRKIEEYLDTLA